MKLAAHYNKVNIWVSVITLFIGAIIYFFAISKIAQGQLDRDLSEEVSELLQYVNVHHQLPSPADFDEDQTTFTKIGSGRIDTKFYDATYRSSKSTHERNGRAVEGSFFFNGQNYKFVIVISRESAEDLVQIIMFITLTLVVLLLLTLFIANKFLLNGLWQPFYAILNYLKTFNLSAPETFELENKRVTEFKELAETIALMTAKVKTDYSDLKQFTENASHEMMTPVAVITSKLDSLIQEDGLQAKQYEYINGIYEATNRLSRLNNALLLMVKIENNLMGDAAKVDIKEEIMAKLNEFKELLSDKNITIVKMLEHRPIHASKQLIEILLNNLIGNAIRHNVKDGLINIQFQGDRLTIYNTGTITPLAAESIFKRFNKSKNSDGLGLGLALVKNICTLYKWDINYFFDGRLHVFEVIFDK